jgi:hypothetical protein
MRKRAIQRVPSLKNLRLVWFIAKGVTRGKETGQWQKWHLRELAGLRNPRWVV